MCCSACMHACMHASAHEGRRAALQLPGVCKGGPLAQNAVADASDAALRRTLLYMASRRGSGRGRLMRLGQLEDMDVPEVTHCVLHVCSGRRCIPTQPRRAALPSAHGKWPAQAALQALREKLLAWRALVGPAAESFVHLM